MLEAAQSFMRELDAMNWKYREPRETDDGKVVVSCGVNGKSARYDLFFIFDADGRSMGIRTPELAKVPIDKKLPIMDLINQLNMRFRWIKFFIDGEENINAQIDTVLRGDAPGKTGVEMMVRMFKIIDEAYPQFMRTIWSE